MRSIGASIFIFSACVLMVLVFVSGVSGVLGPMVQGFLIVEIVIVAVSVVLLGLGRVLLSGWSGTRTDLAGCQESAADRKRQHPACDIDRRADRLRVARRDENEYAERYLQRRCAVEDALRAKALRLQAEIDFMRHEKRIKSWAEVCAEYHSCQH